MKQKFNDCDYLIPVPCVNRIWVGGRREVWTGSHDWSRTGEATPALWLSVLGKQTCNRHVNGEVCLLVLTFISNPVDCG